MPVNPVPRYSDGRPPVVSSGFRTGDRPTHNGADIMYPRSPSDGGPPNTVLEPHYARRYWMPYDVPALAYDDGVVVESKQIGTGGYVVLLHKGGIQTQYMHLRNRRVSKDEVVKAGQPIGSVHYNPSGFKLIHLHFQVRKNGVLQNPAPYLASATIVDRPVELGPFLVKVGVAAGLGYLAYRYVFT